VRPGVARAVGEPSAALEREAAQVREQEAQLAEQMGEDTERLQTAVTRRTDAEAATLITSDVDARDPDAVGQRVGLRLVVGVDPGDARQAQEEARRDGDEQAAPHP